MKGYSMCSMYVFCSLIGQGCKVKLSLVEGGMMLIGRNVSVNVARILILEAM